MQALYMASILTDESLVGRYVVKPEQRLMLLRMA